MNAFEEFIKCQNDFNYFVSTYIKITHPKRGIIPLELHDYQRRFVKTCEENRFVLALKFRQGGFTTLIIIYGLWKCMFHYKQSILFVSRTDREATHVGQIVSNVLDKFPEWLIPRMGTNSQNHKTFTVTNSAMHFCCPIATIGKAATLLVIDEVAFIPNMDEIWKRIYPCISTSGRVIAVSTVNGIGNWFEETYHNAIEGKNAFHVFECSYEEHPDYKNPEWVAQMRKQLGEKGFYQEILCKFLIDGQTIEKNQIAAIKAMSNKELSERLKSFRWKYITLDDLDALCTLNEACDRLINV